MTRGVSNKLMPRYIRRRKDVLAKMAWMRDHYDELLPLPLWQLTDRLFAAGLYSPKTAKSDAMYHVRKFWAQVQLDRQVCEPHNESMGPFPRPTLITP